MITRFTPPDDGEELFHLKIYHNGSLLPLSDVMPQLENMGLRVMDQVPYSIEPVGRATVSSWVANSSWKAYIPDLGEQGMTVAGHIKSASAIIASTITISGVSTNSSFGTFVARKATTCSADFTQIPYSGLAVASGGLIYSINTATSSGTVFVSQITDVV